MPPANIAVALTLCGDQALRDEAESAWWNDHHIHVCANSCRVSHVIKHVHDMILGNHGASSESIEQCPFCSQHRNFSGRRVSA